MANINNDVAALSKGMQIGSYYEGISQGPYSSSLSIEKAILTRDIYLPLLPRERLGSKVLEAYDYLALEGELPESEYHPSGYWFKEDVYAKGGYGGNFYIPMLSPNYVSGEGLEPSDYASDFGNSVTAYTASEPNIVGGSLPTLAEGNYGKGNIIILIVPTHIALQFTSKIPKGTEFAVGFIGGRSHIANINILSVTKAVLDEEDPWASEPDNYEGFDGEIEDLADKILDHLDAIEAEEERRAEEKEGYDEEFMEFSWEGEGITVGGQKF